VSFHRHLSDKTVYLRYFSPVSLAWRTAAKRLAGELCDDPDHHLTFVIERRAAGSGLRSLIGVGRLVMSATHTAAEFSVTIRDDFQGMGLGGALLDALIEAARAEGLHTLRASVLPENRRMLDLCRTRAFRVVSPGVGGPVEVLLDLRA
jgi:acetyltransferase